jgi:hypothetical protein
MPDLPREQIEAHAQELYDALTTFAERVIVGEFTNMEIIRAKDGDIKKAVQAIVRWERRNL